MAVITISRDFASGGRRLGRLVARRLGYEYVDKSLFQKIAEDLNVSERTLESFEKGREYRISNIFATAFSKRYIHRIVGFDKSVVEEQEYKTSLEKLILEVAQEDNVVIIGRAAFYFLKDFENCYSFQLFAPMGWRKRYAVENLNIPRTRAQKIIEKIDNNHRWFLKSVCEKEFDSPYLFHLTMNMSVVSFEKAVELVMSVANLE